MNDKVNKKDNAFVRWTEKHAEFWKFIKFNCAGALSNIPEFATQLVLLYLVFKCADDPNARGTQISYYCSTFVGYAVAYLKQKNHFPCRCKSVRFNNFVCFDGNFHDMGKRHYRSLGLKSHK